MHYIQPGQCSGQISLQFLAKWVFVHERTSPRLICWSQENSLPQSLCLKPFLKGCSQLGRRQGFNLDEHHVSNERHHWLQSQSENWFIASDMWSEVSICTVRTNWLEPNHVLSHVSVKDMVWILTLRERDSTQTHLPLSEARGMRYHMKLGSRNRCLPELRRGR